KIGETRVIGEDLAQDRRRAHVDVFVGNKIQVTRATEVLHEAPADRVGIRAMGVGETLFRKIFRFARELAMLFFEERPLQVREAVHGQSPVFSHPQIPASSSPRTPRRRGGSPFPPSAPPAPPPPCRSPGRRRRSIPRAASSW